MSPIPPQDQQRQTVNLHDEANWKTFSEGTFVQTASLQIAQRILFIFGGVYVAGFLIGAGSLFLEGATFESALELIRLMITSILPLVTLAVGFYLGDERAETS